MLINVSSEYMTCKCEHFHYFHPFCGH